MLFACKICKEKDIRISDLKEQIKFLRSQIVIDSDPAHVSALHLEADGVLSGQQHVIHVPDVQEREEMAVKDQAEIERSERDRLLSGAY